MQFSTKCWSEHILSAHKATKDLKLPLYMTFNINIITRNYCLNQTTLIWAVAFLLSVSICSSQLETY